MVAIRGFNVRRDCPVCNWRTPHAGSGPSGRTECRVCGGVAREDAAPSEAAKYAVLAVLGGVVAALALIGAVALAVGLSPPEGPRRSDR